MRVLVTGGAGYIGSVVTEQLVADGHQVVVYDNLSKGHGDAVVEGAELVEAELFDSETLNHVLYDRRIEAVIHMAASSLVGESVDHPNKYYQNNVIAGLGLLDAMLACDVKQLVFSSTAAVYGEPEAQPIEEAAVTNPTNPYGETKLAFEHALKWYDRAHGLRYASLRYFNAAGATGKRPRVEIYGDDYPTPDGTCIRDYIHVVDLARAHIQALDALVEESRIYNLGCGGAGYSVKEVIDTARRVTGREIPTNIGPRRPGDPAVLVASSDRIKTELGWKPQFQDLELIVESAWRWMRSHEGGYAE
jgi:UDP-glucose 4-epimerase